MQKSRLISIFVLILGLAGISVFGVTKYNASYDVLDVSGYIAVPGNENVSLVVFENDTRVKNYKQGYVKIEAASGDAVVDKETVMHLSDDSISSFSDATLVDLDDLSDNFINFYYIPAGMAIENTGNGKYKVDSSEGENTFGENILKYSDSQYIIQSPQLTVHISDSNETTVEDYVQISVSEDGIVSIVNEDKIWKTFSDDCYIKTQDGVEIYPVQQLITDGNYKLSLAKITVDPDDTIVLTEDETRRQIVPEINIETIDGKDGSNGSDAENGLDGNNGENAQNGENGANGNDGDDAKDGEDGGNGKDAEDGDDGGDGADAKKGVDGSNASGTSSTNSVIPTMTFVDWNVNATGLSGLISISDESGFLSELAESETVSTDTHPATVKITNNDTGEVINCYPIQFQRDDTTQKITYKSVDTTTNNIKDIYTQEEVGFSTSGDPLLPDTSYTISVSAYYIANETVYHREFISRAFYTDSTGVVVNKVDASTESIKLGVSVSSSNVDDVDVVRVFLLTESENESFSLANLNTSLSLYNYVDIRYNTTSNAVVLHKNDGTSVLIADKVSDKAYQEIEFTGLSSNSFYKTRTYVDMDEIEALTGQIEDVCTLKQSPYYQVVDSEEPTKTKKISIGVSSTEVTDTVTAYYNRVTGGFEVYRPTMYDQDGGIVRFKYTAKTKDPDDVSLNPSYDTVVQTKYVYPSESEPTVFFLDSEVPYIFDVEVEFFDNEKTVYFQTLSSDPIISYGSTLPKLVLTTDNKTSSTFSGTLQIKMDDQNSKLYIDTKDPSHYLQLDIYSDGIYDQTIQLKAENTPYVSPNGYCSATYLTDSSTNYVNIALDFSCLCANSNYTITVSGCIDLNDTNGPVRRGLGSVSFITRDMDVLKATLSTSGFNTEDTSIAVNLQLAPSAASLDPDFAITMIENGELTLGLYSGTNKNKTLIVTTTLTGSALEDVTEEGIVITEKTFGSTTINANAEYTIVIESVSDNTYSANLDYVNYFTVDYPDYVTLNADGVLPDLYTDPTKGVTVTTITNAFASDYGGTYDSSIPDDAIVGYKLQANYDNAGRMAKRVHYYAFEWSDFVESMFAGIDPLCSNADIDYEGDNPKTNRLYEVEIDVGDSNTVPSVVFFFGNNPKTKAPTTNSQQYASYVSGSYVFYVGNATTVGNELKSGMSRGFRYVFAYDLTYEKKSTGEEQNYPRNYTSSKKGNYSSYVQYGAGVLNGITIVNDTRQIYILNSGMVEAPCILPTFQTYIYNTSFDGVTGTTASGRVTIHYHYTDPDSLIVESGTNQTYVKWDNNKSSDVLVSTNADRVVSSEKGNKWYSLTIPFVSHESTDLYYPYDTLDVMVDLTNYSAVKSDKYIELLTETFGYTEEELKPSVYLDRIPLDYYWDSYFNSSSKTTALKYSVNSSTLSQNYFNIVISENGDSDFMKYIKQRTAFAMVTTQILDDSLNPDENYTADTYYLPISYSNISDDSSISIKLTTGLLGNKYINKIFSIECTLYYENGYQGTAFATNTDLTVPKYFLTRNYVVEENATSSISYTGYNRASASLDGDMPNGSGIIAGSEDLSANIRNVIKNSVKSQFNYKYVTADKSVGYYYYPYAYGIMFSGGSRIDSPVTNYTTIKQLSGYSLFSASTVTAQLTSVVPVVNDVTFSNTSSMVSVNNFSVEGIDSIAGTTEKEIYCRLYKTKSDAINRSSNNLVCDTQTIKITGDDLSSNTFSYSKSAAADGNVIEFTGDNVEKGASYYVVFFAKVDGKEVTLLDKTTADYAVYQTKTLASVSATISNCSYYNYGYFDKKLEISYMLTSYNGLEFRYDVYNSLYDAENDVITYTYNDGTFTVNHSIDPILTHEEIVALDALYEPAYYSTGSVYIILNPGTIRKTIQAGGEYAVKMSVLDKTSTKVSVLGSSSSEFSIPASSGVSAVTSLIDATTDSVTYQVTITDQSNLIMGAKDYQDGAGLYTVRFTYEYVDEDDGNKVKEMLLVTDYDGKVFATNTNGLKKEFVLSNEHLTYYQDGQPVYDGQEILPNTTYKIHIFAVCDFDEDGLSEITAIESDSKKDWSYFFSNIQTDGLCQVFNKFVDDFWPVSSHPSLTANNYVDGIRELYEIGTRSQRTLANGETYFFNEEYAQFTRASSSKLSLILTESFNIASNNNTSQAFSKIVYSISGLDQSGNAVSVSGESSASKGDNLFIETTLYGYKAFEYTIPDSISKGRYWITLQFYENNETVPAITLSKAYTD